MTALAVIELSRKAELIEVPTPLVDKDTVVVRTAFSGVSVGTEMWRAIGRRTDYGSPPFINGYQATGVIEEVGESVTGLHRGDPVAVFCRGSHAQFVRSTPDLVLPLAGEESLLPAALFVQPCVAANALNLAAVAAGDSVLVVGQGLIGQCTGILARLRGAYVVATEVAPRRLAVSRSRCADWTIDASQVTSVWETLKPRFPEGMDVVVESTGFQDLLNGAFECCRDGGRFVFEGWYPDEVSFHFHTPHRKQVTVSFPFFIGSRGVREAVIRLIESRILDMGPLISHVVGWRDSGEAYTKLFGPHGRDYNGLVFRWSD